MTRGAAAGAQYGPAMLSRLTGTAGAAGAAALVALLTSCSGGAGGDSPADSAGSGAPAASSPEAGAVRAAFTGYTGALLARDFTGACAALTDQAAQALVADINAKNIPARSCDQAYAALYAVPEAAQKLDESNRTVQVTDVTVDGATANLTYTGTVAGRPIPQQTIRAEQGPAGWRIAPSG